MAGNRYQNSDSENGKPKLKNIPILFSVTDLSIKKPFEYFFVFFGNKKIQKITHHLRLLPDSHIFFDATAIYIYIHILIYTYIYIYICVCVCVCLYLVGDMGDLQLLFCARLARMVAFGGLAVVLILLLQAQGLSATDVGFLLSLILAGDLAMSLYLTTHADRFGRRVTLLLGSFMSLVAALVFAKSHSFVMLALAGIFGIITPTGNEIGPFLAVEQAALTDVLSSVKPASSGVAAAADDGGESSSLSLSDSDKILTKGTTTDGNEKKKMTAGHVAGMFGLYHAVGEAAKAGGALLAGHLVARGRAIHEEIETSGGSGEEGWNHEGPTGTTTAGGVNVAATTADIESLRAPVYVFAAASAIKMILYYNLSPAIEARVDSMHPDPPSSSMHSSSSSSPSSSSSMHSTAAASSAGAAAGNDSVASEHVSHRGDGGDSNSKRNSSLFARVALHFGVKRPESRATVARLSALFSVDAFAGGFVMHSFLVYWFAKRWSLEPAALGTLLLAVNLVAAASGVAAGWFVRRYGAVRTMVFSHLPSNVLLMLVPVMPSASSAVAMLVLKCSISQMDVPARQAYVATVVASDERSAAGGITNIARSLGLIVAPLLLGYFMAATPGSGAFDAPFYIAGVLKIIYDITLYRQFVASGMDLSA